MAVHTVGRVTSRIGEALDELADGLLVHSPSVDIGHRSWQERSAWTPVGSAPPTHDAYPRAPQIVLLSAAAAGHAGARVAAGGSITRRSRCAGPGLGVRAPGGPSPVAAESPAGDRGSSGCLCRRLGQGSEGL